MSSTQKHCCMTCKWAWAPDPKYGQDEGLEAECHRYPPQIAYAGDRDRYGCMWPAVGYEHGCGEWAADEED